MSFRDIYTNPLTNDQQKALELALKWFNTPGVNEFTLSGYAGTGKTYWVNHFLKQIHRTVCVTAPTHKAVKQIAKATGKVGKTIQSLHGLRPNFNIEYNFNNPQFDPIGTPHLNAYSLIVIDESSMVTQSLRALNKLRATQYGVKILYVGDDAQLPPINENLSTIFSIPGYKLTEIVRQQEGNPLLKILALARNDVFANTDKLLNYLSTHKSEFNSNQEGFIVLDRKNFTETIIQYFASEPFSQDVEFVRYGSHTNANILAWNNVIRNSILVEHDNLISEHDLLTGYKTIVDKNMNLMLTNSADYYITNIVRRTTNDGFDVFTAELIGDDKAKRNVSIVDFKSPNYGKFLSQLIRRQNSAKYASASNRNKKWGEFYEYKDSFLTMSPILLPDEKYPIQKDIDYGYGLTIHKLQGSTIENVFINLPDIVKFSTGQYNNLRQRLLYTAMSRASKRVIFLKL